MLRSRIHCAVIAAVLIWMSAGTAVARVVGDTITLGVAISFSGERSTCGINARNGYQLAVDRINAGGGVSSGSRSFKLRIVYYDDESSAERTAQLLEHLIKRDGIRFLLGPCGAAAASAAAAISEQYQVPMIDTQSAAPGLFDKGYGNVFSVRVPAARYFPGAVALGAESGARAGRYPASLKAALVFERHPFATEARAGAVAALDGFGMQVVVDEPLPSQIPEMTAIVDAVRESKPDLLLVSGRARGAYAAASRLGDLAPASALIVMTHCEAAAIVTRLGAAAENLVCATPWADRLPFRGDLFGTAADYADTFKATYEGYRSVPQQAAQATAAVLVWKNAFERAGDLTPAQVRGALADTDLQSFYGRIVFSERGENSAGEVVLRQIQDGVPQVVWPARWATHRVRYSGAGY